LNFSIRHGKPTRSASAAWEPIAFGNLSADAAGKLKDRDGETVDEVRRKRASRKLQDVKLAKLYKGSWVHIEQVRARTRADSLDCEKHRSAGEPSHFDSSAGGTPVEC